MPQKKFRLNADQIKPIAKGYGACLATDAITIEGRRVGYMYRQQPENDLDSGWHFFAGDETQDYMDDPSNIAIYDVNTIANYDPGIIPLLDSRVDSAFERDSSGQFVEVEAPSDE